MTFEEIKHVPFLPEQARTHIAALVAHCNRTERKITHYEMKIDKLLRKGDKASIEKAQQLYHIKQERIGMIEEMEKEIARMRDIFGDCGNGKG